MRAETLSLAARKKLFALRYCDEKIPFEEVLRLVECWIAEERAYMERPEKCVPRTKIIKGESVND